MRWFLIFFIGVEVISAQEAKLLWNYLTDQERAQYSSYQEFETFYNNSLETGEIEGYVSDSLFTVGKSFGNYHIGGWSEMDAYKDTLYVSSMGQDCVRKFTSSGDFVSYFGNRKIFHYIWSVAVNEEHIACACVGGISWGGAWNYIVDRINPSAPRVSFHLPGVKLSRTDMDSVHLYAILDDSLNGQYGALFVSPDSCWDTLYVLNGNFCGLKIDEDKLYMIDSHHLYQYKVLGDADSIVRTDDFSFSPSSKLQDVSTSSRYVFVAAFKETEVPDTDSLFIFRFGKGSFTSCDTFYLGRAYDMNAYVERFYSLSLEVIGDTLYVMLLRPSDIRNRRIERYLIAETGLRYLDSFGVSMDHPRWWPVRVGLFDGRWISTNSYGVTRLTFRRPDGNPYRFITLPWETHGITGDSEFLYVSTYENITDSIPLNGVYKIDTLGDTLVHIVDSFTVIDTAIFRVALFKDTLVAEMLRENWGCTIFLINPDDMQEVYRCFDLPSSTSRGSFYLSREGFIFYPYNKPNDDYSSIRVYDLNGNLHEELFIDQSDLRYYSVSVNEDVFPWRVYVGTLFPAGLKAFEFNPKTHRVELLDSLGQDRSIHSYWSWDQDLDDDYLPNPTYVFQWNPVVAGNKVFLTDVFNTRLLVYLPPVVLQSDTEKATAFPNQRHFLRIPNTNAFHLIYESQGNVYYHYAPDGEGSWIPPKIIKDAKNPSIYSVDTSWVDIVFIQEGKLKYVGFDPDYTMGKTLTLITEETNVKSPVVLRNPIENPNLLHVIYEGELNGTHVLSHGTYDIGRYRKGEIEARVTPEGHFVIDDLEARDGNQSAVCDEVLGHIHVLYQKRGELYYSEYSSISGWLEPENISHSGGLSEYPFIDSYGDWLYAVWDQDMGMGNFDVMNKKKHIWEPWSLRVDTIMTPGESRYPVSAGGEFTVWSEGAPDLTYGGWEIYCQRSGEEPVNISNTPNTNSKFSHVSVEKSLESVYVYSVWTEGDSGPYTIKIKRNHFPLEEKKLPAFLTVKVGSKKPSIYTVERTGSIGSWVYPVDYGETTLIYRFPRLNPEMIYKVEPEFYHEGPGIWIAKVYINGNYMGLISYPSGILQSEDFLLPPEFNQDGELTVRLERVRGDHIALAGLKVYRYEQSGEVGSGAASSSPIVTNTMPILRVKPSIFSDELKIQYTVPGDGSVKINVYDITGREVMTLLNKIAKTGSYSLKWNGRTTEKRNLPGGVYFIRLEALGNPVTRKVILLR